MNCEHCGAALRKDDKFCAACGAPARKLRSCPACRFPVRDDARFCIKCGAAVERLSAAVPGEDAAQRTRRSDAIASAPQRALTLAPTVTRTPPGSRRAAPPAGRAARDAPQSNHTVWPAVLLILACIAGVAVYMMLTSNGHKEARTPTGTSTPSSAARPDLRSGASGAFSTPQAFKALYGNYDPNLDGAFWTVSGAPKAYAQWNGRPVFLRTLISRTFEQRGVTRHIVVTNSLDVKDGLVVKQGAGCRTCPSLVGASVFEKGPNGWTLISRHDFLTADGAWGAPPKVSAVLPARGGIELQFDRPAIDQRNPGRQYSIMLKDRADAAERTSRSP